MLDWSLKTVVDPNYSFEKERKTLPGKVLKYVSDFHSRLLLSDTSFWCLASVQSRDLS